MSFISNIARKLLANQIQNEVNNKVQAQVAKRLEEKEEADKERQRSFDNSMVGRPVILIQNNYELPMVGIISGHSELSNSTLPLVDIYSDNEVHQVLSFAAMVEFSPQRLSALLKLSADERVALCIKSYTYGRDAIDLSKGNTEEPIGPENIDVIFKNLRTNGFFDKADEYYND